MLRIVIALSASDPRPGYVKRPFGELPGLAAERATEVVIASGGGIFWFEDRSQKPNDRTAWRAKRSRHGYYVK